MEKYVFDKLNKEDISKEKSNLDILKDVNTELTIVLGKSETTISNILKFKPGSLINLKRDISELTVDINVGDKNIATGEVVVIDSNVYIKILEINKNS